MLSGSHRGGLRSGHRQSTALHYRARQKAALPLPQSERRFSACRLAANARHICMVDLALKDLNERLAPSTRPISQAPDAGARPFEATNTSSDLVSARLRPSSGLAPASD